MSNVNLRHNSDDEEGRITFLVNTTVVIIANTSSVEGKIEELKYRFVESLTTFSDVSVDTI